METPETIGVKTGRLELRRWQRETDMSGRTGAFRNFWHRVCLRGQTQTRVALWLGLGYSSCVLSVHVVTVRVSLGEDGRMYSEMK